MERIQGSVLSDRTNLTGSVEVTWAGWHLSWGGAFRVPPSIDPSLLTRCGLTLALDDGRSAEIVVESVDTRTGWVHFAGLGPPPHYVLAPDEHAASSGQYA